MSEFKFACPVCGQHITAASASSGTQIECPTCFQTIVVPQPRAADSKLILNAAQPTKPRPIQAALQEMPVPRRSRAPMVRAAVLLLLVAGASSAIFVFRERLGLIRAVPPAITNAPSVIGKAPHPIPSNVVWTTNLADVILPDAKLAGALRGQGFNMSRATLQGGNLSVRQGKGSPPELGLSVIFPAKRGEDLSGKSVKVLSDQPPPLPKVVLRWRDDQGKGISKTFAGGYTLQVEFGQAVGGRMPGKMYIALPDETRSVLAGTFNAEIRAPQAPKKKAAPAVTQQTNQ